MGLREDILALNDCAVEEFEVPEWKRVICVRGLTLDERTAIADEANSMNGASEAQKNSLLTRRLVQYGVCHPDGQRVFEDGDVGALGARNANVVDRIGLRVSELSRITPDSVRELEKNSAATLTDASASS